MIASVVGMIAAANTPMSARIAMTNPTVVGSDESAVATMNPVSPTSRVRRSPNRSPTVPAINRNPANVKV